MVMGRIGDDDDVDEDADDDDDLSRRFVLSRGTTTRLPRTSVSAR